MQQAAMIEVKLKLPVNIAESLAKNELISLLLDKAYNKAEYYLTRCNEMEQKYGKPFTTFKTQVENSEEEEFQEWDDLIEWEAYEIAYKSCVGITNPIGKI